ncbi:UvrD-helicase domain-containing protein [Paenibacillus polymyxa]|uniref:UvrD-helicase domain-containing protein n=1 Tax=Paenibacillus polymyxa TaxID=1406 RepID=UPI002ED14B4A|nr:UvrD-helicase domain-containing protein [Paenibacillus polymyxa]
MALPPAEGKQREVLALPVCGHTVVLGTAGSGKTLMAIKRAAYLAEFCGKDEKVLLVTFNKALVTYLNSISNNELRKVDVRNYHKFAIGYLNSRNLMGSNIIVPAYDKNRWTKTDLIQQAIRDLKKKEPENTTFQRDVNVFIEEINWIQKMGIKTLREYEEVERVGRSGTRITRNNRKHFWTVVDTYMQLRANHGYKYDFEDIASYVERELECDDTKRYYKHIVIDEGQDLSPTMLRSLTKAIPSDGSIIFFGDVAQQIYGGRISWRNAGFNVKDVCYFEQNYRNTKEIATLGLAISKSKYFQGIPDMVEPHSPRAEGVLPAVIRFSDEKKEIFYHIERAKKEFSAQTVGILARSRKDVDNIVAFLKIAKANVQVLHGDMIGYNLKPGISVGTYHAAKGLEFDIIILPYFTSNRLPDPERIVALEGEEEAMAEEVKLVYVAVTRAKRGLIISYTGELTELLPTNENDLYQEFTL